MTDSTKCYLTVYGYGGGGTIFGHGPVFLNEKRAEEFCKNQSSEFWWYAEETELSK